MASWWEIGLPDVKAPALVRAVAYYRHSAQGRQENSIPIQQDQVRSWAREHGVEIIREFCDAGRSGLNSEGRPAFTEMMDSRDRDRGAQADALQWTARQQETGRCGASLFWKCTRGVE